MRRSGLPSPQAPASAAFPSHSLTGSSHGSARARVICFDLGTESRVLESNHPNSGKRRASPSREGRFPAAGGQDRSETGPSRAARAGGSARRFGCSSGSPLHQPHSAPCRSRCPPSRENRLPGGKILPEPPGRGSWSGTSQGLTAGPPSTRGVSPGTLGCPSPVPHRVVVAASAFPRVCTSSWRSACPAAKGNPAETCQAHCMGATAVPSPPHRMGQSPEPSAPLPSRGQGRVCPNRRWLCRALPPGMAPVPAQPSPTPSAAGSPGSLGSGALCPRPPLPEAAGPLAPHPGRKSGDFQAVGKNRNWLRVTAAGLTPTRPRCRELLRARAEPAGSGP